MSTNKPAYPTHSGSPGMSLYEHIAIEAMKALLSNPEYVRLTTEQIAKTAITMANTMTEEL